MARKAGIGHQDFGGIKEINCVYVDKTDFIKEWWDGGDQVTLITRPRRFGKTLMMSTVEYFFSVEYAGRGDLFEGLSIWEDEKYRDLQGKYPVIFLSFLGKKGDTFDEMYEKFKLLIMDLFRRAVRMMDSEIFTQFDRDRFFRIVNGTADRSMYVSSLSFLSEILFRHYGKKVIILIDEYDTPMNHAYVSGYWTELVKLFKDFFTDTLKVNRYLERAVLTGITRISKESFFSELNNLEVVSVTSDVYETVCGFTENEVFALLEEFGLEHEIGEVKRWYDGFQFGTRAEIYNPWSIINFLRKKKLSPYWVNTGSNDLISVLVRRGSWSVNHVIEDLLNGKSFRTVVDEQIVFAQLESDDSENGGGNAIWSLLLASGYLKALAVDGEEYELTLTNYEVYLAFRQMVRMWFAGCNEDYKKFIDGLLHGDLDRMNKSLNEIVIRMTSSFDSGTKPSKTEPEKFYHGLTLGMLVALEGRYVVSSNMESGYGRYDVTLEPLHHADDGIILEFKVLDSEKETDLQDTVNHALRQIVDNRYSIGLERRIPRERIRIYGFAFTGKKVLIGGGPAGAYV